MSVYEERWDSVLLQYIESRGQIKYVGERKLTLTRWGFRRINESFKLVKSNAVLTEDILKEVIEPRLHMFLWEHNHNIMKEGIEQYLLAPERDAFVRDFTKGHMMPYTIAYFEKTFGANRVVVSADKKLPFAVVKHRQDMDYVVFVCNK